MINSIKDRIRIKKYIKQSLRKGYNKEQIIEVMEKINWKREDIEDIFNDIKKKRFNITIEKPSKPPEEVIEETTTEPETAEPPTGDTDSVYTIDDNQTTILFDERDGKEKILIRTYKGDFFHIDVDEQKLQGYFKEGIDLKSDGDIKMTGKNLHFKATENLNQEAGDDVNIKSGSKMNIESGAHMNISSGSEINMESVTDISVKANGSINEQATAALSLKSSASVAADAPIVSDNGGLSQPAKSAASAQGAEAADPQGNRDT